MSCFYVHVSHAVHGDSNYRLVTIILKTTFYLTFDLNTIYRVNNEAIGSSIIVLKKRTAKNLCKKPHPRLTNSSLPLVFIFSHFLRDL